ncbi:hypothetical protein ABLN85_08485, partial [Mycobacterium tuberculosis]
QRTSFGYQKNLGVFTQTWYGWVTVFRIYREALSRFLAPSRTRATPTGKSSRAEISATDGLPMHNCKILRRMS